MACKFCKDRFKCARTYKRLRKEAVADNEMRSSKKEIHRLKLEMADLKFRMNCEELLRKFIHNERM